MDMEDRKPEADHFGFSRMVDVLERNTLKGARDCFHWLVEWVLFGRNEK